MIFVNKIRRKPPVVGGGGLSVRGRFFLNTP